MESNGGINKSEQFETHIQRTMCYIMAVMKRMKEDIKQFFKWLSPRNQDNHHQKKRKYSIEKCLFLNTYVDYNLEHTKNMPNLQIRFDSLFPKLPFL